MKRLKYIMLAMLFTACTSNDRNTLMDSSSEEYPGTYNNQMEQDKSGLITAGEHNDLINWKEWLNKSDQSIFTDIAKFWEINPNNRIAISITNEKSEGYLGCKVQLKSKTTDEVIWEQKTDVNGTCNLFWSTDRLENQYVVDDFYITIDGHVQKQQLSTGALNKFYQSSNLNDSDILQIAFMVDATGSMGDEIQFLKEDLMDVLNKAETLSSANLEVGCVFYRDEGDEYITRLSSISSNIHQSINFIKKQGAAGGGDYPEAVDIALEKTINSLQWRDNASKIAFLLLDAPPRNNDETMLSIQTSIYEAASQGIKLIPITASGVNKNTEYLMRSMAILTNGTYCFITDDSGIGLNHIQPDVQEYEVELLNDLLLRLILANAPRAKQKYYGI